MFADAVKVRREIGWLISVDGSLECFIYVYLFMFTLHPVL